MQQLRFIGAGLRRLHPELVRPDLAGIAIGVGDQRVLVVVQTDDDESSLRLSWIQGRKLMNDVADYEARGAERRVAQLQGKAVSTFDVQRGSSRLAHQRIDGR